MAPLIVLVTATLLLRLVGQLAIVGLRDWAVATRGVAPAVVSTFAILRASFSVAVLPDLRRILGSSSLAKLARRYGLSPRTSVNVEKSFDRCCE